MLDLKPYFDAVNAADVEVQTIANEIDVKFREGTEEGKLQALALRPALDEAQNKHVEAVALYDSMQKTTRPNDVAKNFIPVSETPTDPDGEAPRESMNFADFQAMSPKDRMSYSKGGGKIV